MKIPVYECPHCGCYLRTPANTMFCLACQGYYCPACNEMPLSEFDPVRPGSLNSDPDPEDLSGESWKKA